MKQSIRLIVTMLLLTILPFALSAAPKAKKGQMQEVGAGVSSEITEINDSGMSYRDEAEMLAAKAKIRKDKNYPTAVPIRRSNNIGLIIVGVLSFLALLLSAIDLWMILHNKRHAASKSYVRYKINELQENTDLNVDDMTALAKQMKKTIGKVKDLEDDIIDIKRKNRTIEQTFTSQKIAAAPVMLQNGYLGRIKGDRYFDEEYSSKDDRSYFTFRRTDDSHLEFEPFDLRRLKSANWLNSCLIIDYNCTMPEANDMKVIKAGTAEFKNNMWEITSKASISVSKR